MRFNKRTRKIGIRKRNKRTRASANRNFWWMLLAGLALMGAFLFVTYGGQTERLRRIRHEKIQADMDRICVAAVLFYQEHNRYPSPGEGLEILWKDLGPTSDPAGPPSRRRPQERVPLDPWGNAYRYRAPQGDAPLCLLSLGADGKPGGEGDDADVVREGCKSAALAGG